MLNIVSLWVVSYLQNCHIDKLAPGKVILPSANLSEQWQIVPEKFYQNLAFTNSSVCYNQMFL